jgi:hypothetical protein
MDRAIRNVARLVLFVLLFIVLTGIWACLWLPPV